MKLRDKEALRDWDAFKRDLISSSPVDHSEDEAARKKRIDYLLSDFEAFCYYYFPKICKAKFAKFHKKFAKAVVDNDRCFVTRMWARDHAKSSVLVMLVIFLYYKKEFKHLLFVSHNLDKACELLNGVKKAFERNQALINDFGWQKGLGDWTEDRFVTVTGVAFRACGAGQNPRGGRTEDGDRYDIEIFDDLDDPEVCRNPDRLDNNWKFVQGDCFGAFHLSGKRRIIFVNNKIAEDCIIERASKLATDHEQINIYDKDGNPSWKEAYTKADCEEMIRIMEDEAETEYMNNPSTKGKVFLKEYMVFKKLPPLNSYKFLIAYLDGGFKQTKTSDTKSLVLLGKMGNEYHLRKCYVDNASVETMVSWHYHLHDILKRANAQCLWYMEEVFLLDLLYKDFAIAAPKYGFPIPIQGDKRKKPDKDLRIGATAGYFERGQFFIDEDLKDDRFCKKLISQWLKFKIGSKGMKDGPDSVEGAIFLLNQMFAAGVDIGIGKRFISKHRA